MKYLSPCPQQRETPEFQYWAMATIHIHLQLQLNKAVPRVAQVDRFDFTYSYLPL